MSSNLGGALTCLAFVALVACDDGAAGGSDTVSDTVADSGTDTSTGTVGDTSSPSDTAVAETTSDTAVAETTSDTAVTDTTPTDTTEPDTTPTDTAVEETSPDTAIDEDSATSDTAVDDTAVATDVAEEVTPDPCEGVDCGDHGACDDAGGDAECVCDTGYAGDACDGCAAGYVDPQDDGTCDKSECGDGYIDTARGEDCDPGDVDSIFCDDDCGLDCSEGTTAGVEVLLTTGCYAAFDDNVTWTDAQAACDGLGMHMLTIGSLWEQDALADADQHITWLGLQGTTADGLGETWDGGDAVTYTQSIGAALVDPFCLGLFFGIWSGLDCAGLQRYVCELTTCGDGVLQSNELCDDGNGVDGDGCDVNCTPSGCGNGVQDPGEDCEPGGATPCPEGCVFPCGSGTGAAEVVETSIGCYLLYDTTRDFFGARDACAAVGAPLARVDDPNDGEMIAELWVPRYGNLWMGLDDNVTEGSWIWADGTPLGDGRWAPGEPNGTSGSGDEDCAELLGTGRWNDGRCATLHRYLCLDRTCGDGAVEGGEECDELDDVDGDGCDTNCRETGCGNGVVTGDEECDDGNQLDGDGCESDCHFICGDATLPDGAWLGLDGQCYLAFAPPDTDFTAAQSGCQTLGGWLVDIADATENALVASFDMADAWIGYSDATTEATWLWVSGATDTYTNWGGGEPNNSGGAEDCAHIRADGRWNDARCDGKRGYVCEVPL